MKRLKIILSSVSLLMVLVFCVTMGVYAATSVTFRITSTVSFKSPDIEGLTIECYVDHADLRTIKQFTYSTDNNVTSDGDKWDLNTVKNSKGETVGLTYSQRDENDHYAPITLRFVIKHTTGLNLYAYFTKPASGQDTVGTYISEETLYGTKIYGEGKDATTLPLINVEMNDEIENGIVTKPAEGEYNGGEVSIVMALKADATLFEDTVNFNYNLIISKFQPGIESPAE